MNLSQAVRSGYKNFFNYTSRASRSEYWYFVLFYYITMIASFLVFSFSPPLKVFVYFLISIFIGLPLWFLLIRRLHDINRSGWWQFITLIPLVGGIILFIWLCKKGDEKPNRFGPFTEQEPVKP